MSRFARGFTTYSQFRRFKQHTHWGGTSTFRNIAVLGDSITDGTAADNLPLHGYVGLTRTVAQRSLGAATNRGEGMVLALKLSRWTYNGTWTNGNAGPFSASRRSSVAASTASITLVGTDFDFYFLKDSSTAAFTVQIDSETPVVIGGANGSPLFVKVNVASIAGRGAHVITITSPAAGAVDFWGVAANDGASGVQMHNLGISGETAAVAVGAGDYKALTGWLGTLAPDLTILAFGVNDYSTQVSLASFTTSMTALITAAKAVGSVAVLIEPPINQTLAIPQTSYNAVLQSLAASMGVQFVCDIYSRWGSYTAANGAGFESGDGTHPSSLGHADIATALESSMQISAPTTVTMFKYAVGDNLGDYTLSRSSTALQFNSDGTITSVAAFKPRDAHYLGAQRTLVLEPTSTNRAGFSQDITASATWTRVGGLVPTLNAGDPFGGSSLGNAYDSNAAGYMYLRALVSLANDGNQTLSLILKRGTTAPNVSEILLNDDTATVVRAGLFVDWTAAGTPVLTAVAGGAISTFALQVGSGNFWLVGVTGAGALQANTNALYVFPGRNATDSTGTTVGDVYVAHAQVENGLVATTPILNATGSQSSRTGDVLTLSVPGGAGQVGTLYEKYINLSTGALVEQVSALTTSLTYTPPTGRAWIGWKFAQGTHSLGEMQVMA